MGTGARRWSWTCRRAWRPTASGLLTDRLLGYAWPKWAQAGDPVELRVHSPEPYVASLWRYGEEPELVRDIGRFESFGPGGDRQVVPDGDFSATGCGWNHHGRRFPPDERSIIVAPDTSGLYHVHLKGERTGAFFTFPLVVAPRRPQARIAVLASSNDWNAYNDFGGRSNYVGAAGARAGAGRQPPPGRRRTCAIPAPASGTVTTTTR